MKEYAFDIRLEAVVRVTAPSEEEARRLLEDQDILPFSTVGPIRLTEASLYEDSHPYLFEIDGVEVPL